MKALLYKFELIYQASYHVILVSCFVHHNVGSSNDRRHYVPSSAPQNRADTATKPSYVNKQFNFNIRRKIHILFLVGENRYKNAREANVFV